MFKEKVEFLLENLIVSCSGWSVLLVKNIYWNCIFGVVYDIFFLGSIVYIEFCVVVILNEEIM